MEREEEIETIITFLVRQVEIDVTCENSYLTDRIVNNGKLIEKYREELKELKKTA